MKKKSILTMEDLRSLVALADKGSLSAAARSLKIHQSSLSRRLELFKWGLGPEGIKLLKTKSKRLILTEAGESLMPVIRDLVRQYDQLCACIHDGRVAPRVLRLGIGSFGAQCYLPRVLAEARAKLPDWRIEAAVVRGRDRILGVINGTYDLAVVTHTEEQVRGLDPGGKDLLRSLRIEPLVRLGFCVIAGKDTPEGRQIRSMLPGSPISLEQLAKWELVGLDAESGIRHFLAGMNVAGKSVGIRFSVTADVGGWPSAREYARHGLGVAVVPLSTLNSDDIKTLAIRLAPETLAIKESLIHRQGGSGAGLRFMKEALKRAATRHESEVQELWKGKI